MKLKLSNTNQQENNSRRVEGVEKPIRRQMNYICW